MRGDYSEATRTLSEALIYARERKAGLENEARLLADLAHVQMRAGLARARPATIEEAADVARRRGAKVWLAHTEWLTGGPTSPAFRGSVAATARPCSRLAAARRALRGAASAGHLVDEAHDAGERSSAEGGEVDAFDHRRARPGRATEKRTASLWLSTLEMRRSTKPGNLA